MKLEELRHINAVAENSYFKIFVDTCERRKPVHIRRMPRIGESYDEQPHLSMSIDDLVGLRAVIDDMCDGLAKKNLIKRGA